MRHDHNRPFDIEADEAADSDTQFWGTTRSWAPRPAGEALDDGGWQGRTTGSLKAIRDGLTGGGRPRQSSPRIGGGGGIDRTRSHGIVRPQTDSNDRTPSSDIDADEADTEQLARIEREATLGELAAGWIEENEWPDGWSAPTQRVAAVNRRRPPAARDAAPRRPAPEAAQGPRRRPPHVEFELDDLDDLDSVADNQVARRSPVGSLSERLGIGAVDPLLVRLGVIVMIGVLLIPVAMSARSGEASLATEVVALAPAGDLAAGGSTVASTVPESTSAGATAAAAAATAPAAQLSVTDAPVATDANQSAAVVTSAPAANTTQQPPSASATALVEPATADEPAQRLEPVCALTYEAAAGDSWYRIADAAAITPRQLIDANLATIDTPIFPGDEICLPAGAVMPAPPTTSPPATTTPATTRPPSTTAAPTTTAAPVTAPPAPSASQAQVQQLIRDIWPDELEQRALEIAYRESRYVATAYNGWCCYGVFQIYYTAHDSWLDEIGVNTASDLFDARKNITAGYMIYQRAGGWGPWGG